DGQSALSGVASLAVAQAVTSAFDGAPAQETGRLCLTAHLRELARPLKFCDRHVVQGVLQEGTPGPLALTMATEASAALDVIASARFRVLHVTQVDATVRMERGMTLATILGARLGRTVVRPGQRVRVALRVRVLRGPLRTIRFTLRIPHGISPGMHTLRLAGTPAETAAAPDNVALAILIDLFGGLDGNSPLAAQSMAQIVAGYRSIASYDGVKAMLAGQAWPACADAAAGASSGCSTPSACASSPVSCISITMSQPPTSSPLTNSWGIVGQLDSADSSWRIRGSGRMSTAANGASSACNAATVRAEKPHIGCSGVPFMKRITGFDLIASS